MTRWWPKRRDALEAARALAEKGAIPPPLVDSPKCPRCSLVGICLPDETAWWSRLQSEEPQIQLALFDEDDLQAARPPPGEDAVRRLVPARDDLRPLYVTGHGLLIGKSGEVLQIRERDKSVQQVRIGEISQVNIFGNVQLPPARFKSFAGAKNQSLISRTADGFTASRRGWVSRMFSCGASNSRWPGNPSFASRLRARLPRRRSAISGPCCAAITWNHRRPR